jgi:uncharacterized protein
MFLDIHELQRHPVVLNVTFSPGRIDYGEGISQNGNLSVQGTAELLNDAIRLRGTLSVEMEVPCARCLELIRRPVRQEFDLFYSPISSIARSEEVEIQQADLEVGFYHGDGLDLEDAMREQILLSFPMKSICRSDCAGLCPQCGQNRNVSDCGCRPVRTDARWAPLEKFRS